MKKKLFVSLFFMFISISFLFAQANDFNGHWSGKVMNQYDVSYDFITKGNSLTGKVTHYDGSVSDISNGKIMGDSISFSQPVMGETTQITGKRTVNGLTIYFTFQGNDLSADLKKTAAGAK